MAATSIPNSSANKLMYRSTPLRLEATPARRSQRVVTLHFGPNRLVKFSMSAGNLSSRSSAAAAVSALKTARESEQASTKPRILVSEKLGEAELDLLRSYGDVECLYNLSPEDLLAKIGEFDALIVRSGTKVTREVFEATKGKKKLKVVGRAGVGIDNVNLQAATELGCLVINVPTATANSIAAAEHEIALLVAQADASMKTLAVMGFDEVGIEVARRAKGHGMHVVVHDPYALADRARVLYADLMSFNKAISMADFILLRVLPKASTSKILNAQMFRIMKKGVRIICHGGLGLIDEDELVVAINDGTVSQVEVFTSVSANNTIEEEGGGGGGIGSDVVRTLKGELPATLVNAPTFSAQVLTEMRTYFVLAEKLGIVASQLVAGRNRVKIVKVKYTSSRELDTRLLRAMITKGLIETNWGDFVNLVNADFRVEQRGLRIFEENIIFDGSPEIPLESVQVQMHKVKSKFEGAYSDYREIIVEGRVKDGIPHLTKVGLFEVETSLEGRGNLLLCRQVGQDTPTLMAIRVDGELDEQSLKRIGISTDDEFIYLKL